MKSSDSFGFYLNKYFSSYLPGQRGLSTNSILSYRDTFSLFILFLKTEMKIRPENLDMSFMTKDLLLDFTKWLEETRKYSLSSRNQRFVILRTFCKWLSTENPKYLKLLEDISEIKLKKAPKPTMTYLSTEAMEVLLSQPDSSTKNGLRDLSFLAFTYDTGARVSEVINLKFKDIRFSAPSIVNITGKGNKSRIVPLMSQTVSYLKEYITRLQIDLEKSQEQYVFTNRSGGQLSRAGAKYILDKYVTLGREQKPALFPNKISPHTLRHTKAMHMLQVGTNIVYIRDILGHTDLNTTERYAKADTRMKRDALKKAEIQMPQSEMPLKTSIGGLLDGIGIETDMAYWLKTFGTEK